MVRTLAAATIVALMIFVPAAIAADFGTKDEAVAMVKRVQEKFKKDGADATFKAVSDKSVEEFHDRDLYPFIYDMKGTCVAHGARPSSSCHAKGRKFHRRKQSHSRATRATGTDDVVVCTVAALDHRPGHRSQID
jgi:hypothetical protein